MSYRPRIQPADRERFAAAAAPEAILAYLDDVRQDQVKAAREYQWLSALLVTRARQVQNGQWPPEKGETTCQIAHS
jgi:hypothetical protein